MPKECPPALYGAHFLVIDHEHDSRPLVKRILEECQAIVTTAASAEEGLAALRQRKTNVIIFDIGMPGTDGYQLIRAVRQLEEHEGGNSPAIALTAFARSEDSTKIVSACGARTDGSRVAPVGHFHHGSEATAGRREV